jgi:small subunit ribosomal protein S8
MITDPIADMFTRIRNASRKLLEKVDIPSSRMKIAIAEILKKEGYIANYKHIDDYKQGVLRVHLKYDSEGQPVLRGIKRISHSGLRIYRGMKKLPKSNPHFGISLVSTSQGIITAAECRKKNIGGEMIGYVW